MIVGRGIDDIALDPASIMVNRLRQLPKTDRLDAMKPVSQLLRHYCQEQVWSVVHVPALPGEGPGMASRFRQRGRPGLHMLGW